jgi:hypothetical protein
LVPRYRELFRGGSYSLAAYQRDVTDRVRAAAQRYGIGAREPGEAREVTGPKAPEMEQLSLL